MDATALQPVLVTGASGFIGARLARRLIEGHCRVSCLVRANSRIDELRTTNAQLLTGDVTDRGSVERALATSQARTVFHLAGLVKAKHRGDFTLVNTGGVRTIAAACADCAHPPTLVVVSSLAAAGPCGANQFRVEDDFPAPVSDYGRSKLAGEQAAAQYAQALPISIVRPPVVFGPGDRGGLKIFRPIAQWGLHVVPGRGDHSVSLIHVDDLIDGLLLVARKGERLGPHGGRGQGVYFIAGDDQPTYTQLGEAVARALGRKHPTVLYLPGLLVRLIGTGGDVVARFRRHPVWINRDKSVEVLAGSWTCSSVKARTQLGWSPAAPLADRLNETERWYRAAGWL